MVRSGRGTRDQGPEKMTILCLSRSRVPGPGSRIFKSAVAIYLTIMLGACATSYDKRGVYHKVRMGDSIWKIASVYRVDVQELAEYNNILDPNNVQPGMRLYIPQRSKKAAYKKLPFGTDVAKTKTKGRYTRKKSDGDRYSKPIQFYRGRFDWPVEGRVASLFGMRNGRRHDGIDIVAPTGTPIHASAGGMVVFSGTMRGYGNLILIRHKDDFFTAYAHNSVNKVKKGQAVKKNQVVALVGRTGRVTAPHCHFEIRHGQTARNPLFFLPEKEGVASREARAKR